VNDNIKGLGWEEGLLSPLWNSSSKFSRHCEHDIYNLGNPAVAPPKNHVGASILWKLTIVLTESMPR